MVDDRMEAESCALDWIMNCSWRLSRTRRPGGAQGDRGLRAGPCGFSAPTIAAVTNHQL
jgi:hypothetical protein